MKKIAGTLLLLIGLAGCLFLWNYEGTLITEKELLFVVSLIIAGAGMYLRVKHQLKEQHKGDEARSQQLQQLKLTGEKITITLDDCEVKSRSFQQETISDGLPSRVEMMDALYDSNRNYKTQQVQQTYIVVYKDYEGVEYKFISRPTNASVETVRLYIQERKGIDLYVDKNNPQLYMFEFPF